MSSQKGISLIITFLAVTVMLAMALGMVVILLPQIRLITNFGDSISAFYSADTGVEKTVHLAKISPQTGQPGRTAGFCGICSSCNSTTNDCQNCALTPLVANGCNTSCDNCKVTYSSSYDGRNFSVEATVTPGSPAIFYIISTGYFNNIKRTSFYDSSKH